MYTNRSPMMFKSLILLLSVALASVTALKKLELKLYESRDLGHEGLVYRCSQDQYNQCYGLGDIGKTRGLASANFETFDGPNQQYSVTLYSGAHCNGNYDRWAFSRYSGQSYHINSFPTIHRNVHSFKIANFQTSTTSGYHDGFDNTVEGSCEIEF
ncbi:unnamed protein product [Mortierella alpina]